MKRIQNLTIAAMTALVLTAALGVSSAAAAGFTADKYPATVEAEPTQTLSFSTGVLPSIDCSQPKWQGQITAAQSPQVSVEPWETILSCSSASYWGSSTLETKGCSFTFTPGVSGGKGTIGITPGGCGPMHLRNTLHNCDYQLAPQTVSMDPLTNVGSPSAVQATVAVVFHYTQTTGCGAKEGSMRLETQWRLKAFVEGAQVGMYVNKNGLSFNKGLFEAEAYPVAVSGVQDAANKHTLKFGAVAPVKCETTKLDGELAAASAQLSVGASYGGCGQVIAGVLKLDVIEMNSCRYALNGAGTVDVACSKGGDSIVVNLYKEGTEGTLLCQWKIAAQTGLKSVAYSTVGAGSGRGIAVNLTLAGIASTRTAGSALLCGPASTTATYTGGTTLYGPQ